MEKKLKILGYISVTFGVIAALLCITPFPFAVFFAILAGFIGMILSTIYVYIDTKNEINTKKFTPGVLGICLSSIPVLFMLAMIIISKITH